MRHKTTSLLALLTLLLCAPFAQAWNRAGHMVTGAIAYKELKASNPAALGKIIALLKQHPDYPRWQAQITEAQLANENAELYLFEMAARWADDVRQTSYDHPAWHYINFPVVPAGQTITPLPPAPENILKAFASNLNVFYEKALDADKAIALCWLFHLIGDVHQPLHTTALFTSDYPKGDRGGNAIYVRVRPDSATINLHSFWDGLILGSDRFQATTNRATELRATIKRQALPELAAKQFSQWAEESFKLAVQYAYRDGQIKGGPDKDNGVALPGDYIQQTKPVAERRVVLAGYRLADTLANVSTRLELHSTVPSSGTSSTTSPPGAPAILGNKNSKIYHRATCPGYTSVSEKNRVWFKTEAEAEQAGYRKARNCP